MYRHVNDQERRCRATGGPRFIAYYRVSTAKQGASGLGLEAQREAVRRHVAAAAGAIVANFTEIESGKKTNRPQIATALAACRARKATLIIAKLDRLARNVAFISNLMESGVDFVACDNPHANRLTIHILAAIAEDEAKRIAQRTKDALAVVRRTIEVDGSWVARRSGNMITRLGNPNLAEARRRAAAVRRTRPPDPTLLAIIVGLARQGFSQHEIARRLNAVGLRTERGKQFFQATVRNLLAAAVTA
jgi:DNA invertase Pin-like site-specific DNA recombinase